MFLVFRLIVTALVTFRFRLYLIMYLLLRRRVLRLNINFHREFQRLLLFLQKLVNLVLQSVYLLLVNMLLFNDLLDVRVEGRKLL